MGIKGIVIVRYAIYYLSPHTYLHTSVEQRCDQTSNDTTTFQSLRE